MIRNLLLLGAALAMGAAASAAELTLGAETRIAADAPEWRAMAGRFAQRPDTKAEFEERRYFPFRREPVLLKGVVRVSTRRGLSLHYTSPEERVVILDREGVLIRGAAGQTAPPDDPRAGAANGALRDILLFDFSALERRFELHGRREGESWSLGLVPRTTDLRRAFGEILVDGDGATVRRIVLRRSPKQHIDIDVGVAAPVTFSEDEVRRFFR